MSKQLTLFDLSAIAPVQALPVYDPAWDKHDTVDHQITRFDNFSPECPSSQEAFSPHVLEQDTAVTLPVVEYLEKIAGDRLSVVLERDTKNAVPERIKPVPEQPQWVETYSPSKRKANTYYRYCYKQRGKIHHIHIPGGNTRSHLAQSRKLEVESAIADGESPVEIEQLIRSWSNR
ncbi:hypothetical protein [Calothrix sp. NIES-2098]|uniref:hypothetical protein n=1 Tax=Calothrix sp. NIES-2098 TaxID=1954171 RepID=UPI000B5FCD42|nr:hypothetical protein NIES2098_17710 [Calothrix sp. NIES-2098]